MRYEGPGEYHLMVRAAGYRESDLYFEAARPRHERLHERRGHQPACDEPILERRCADDVVVALDRVGSASAADRGACLTGSATRDGAPISCGWISAWCRSRESPDRVNGPVHRGRTIPSLRRTRWQTGVELDGPFRLADVPPSRWWILLEEPNRAPTLAGPVVIHSGDRIVRFDVAGTEPGSIEGRVDHVPDEMAGEVWIIAFDDVQPPHEARVAKDGRFRLEGLPASRYGLKAGHDAYEDPQIAHDCRNEDFETPIDPWTGAVIVDVRAGEATGDVRVDFVAPPFAVRRPPEARRVDPRLAAHGGGSGPVTLTNAHRRLTNRASWVLSGSAQAARDAGHDAIGAEHVLLALLEYDDGVVADALQRLGVDRTQLRRALFERVPANATAREGCEIPAAPSATEHLERTVDEATRAGVEYVATDHFFVALLRTSGIAAEVLHNAGLEPERLRAVVAEILEGERR